MMRQKRLLAGLASIALAAPLAAQQLPPVRRLGDIVATSSEGLAVVAGARVLSNGSVLVNDMLGRRVLLFDASLKSFTVVADSTPNTSNAYGARLGGLIPYRADSTIFVDPSSMSMLMLSPEGKIARVMSVPRSQ